MNKLIDPATLQPSTIPSSQSFRDGMALLPGAVTIVTTDGRAGQHGFTASAVCSVSDAPPTLLVCVNKNTGAHDPILENGVLAVNVLTHAQHPLSNIFSSRSKSQQERFGQADWTSSITGAPVLQHALVSFDCRIANVVEAGSHSVIFAHILHVNTSDANHPGLIWFRRTYAHTHIPE
ncbi:flavin reductase [Acetobacter indonesiensis]|uniref:FMN reductase (NADH) RutF n=1 Tax=Acetobacter indonesiensis TaxID=104101 RepID=A0A6N3T9F7_9PROT|nr:flavin reductase [Acetobacter indonesiensis]MCP1229683.1 flavin reductase [Acetobacter indonesiensis]GAN63686.1 flavin mononucleotide (FMN) reductase [Acetobacter indonesiensis]GEN04249.1 FMN reductase (NADH) RutF [Acetobacter indonesiensis]